MPGIARLIAAVTPASARDELSSAMDMPRISGIARLAARLVSPACARLHATAEQIRARVRSGVRMCDETPVLRQLLRRTKGGQNLTRRTKPDSPSSVRLCPSCPALSACSLLVRLCPFVSGLVRLKHDVIHRAS